MQEKNVSNYPYKDVVDKRNYNKDDKPRRDDEWKHILDSISRTREGYVK
jgi:hypothetical protein